MTSSEPWIAADWSFLAEGGAHVICRYFGGDCNMQGKLLRLRKIMPPVSDQHRDMLSTQGGSGEGHSKVYHERVVSKLLHAPGLLPLETVSLPLQFLKSLQDDIHADRPAHRKRYPFVLGTDDTAWTYKVDAQLLVDATRVLAVTPIVTSAPTPNDKEISFSLPTALSIPDIDNTFLCERFEDNPGSHDLRMKPSPSQTSAISDVWTADIKVKCGLRSCSPFVPPSHAIKRLHGRYKLVQAHKLKSSLQNKQALAWGGQVSSVSAYDPSHLTSGILEYTQIALRNLIQNPQNNFRLLLNGETVYGDTNNYAADSTENPCLAHITKDFLSSDSSARSTTTSSDHDHFLEVISTIAAEEPILSQLQALQSVDILDIEGAEMVYKHLQSSLQNSQNLTGEGKQYSEASFSYNNHSEAEAFISAHALIPHNAARLCKCAKLLMELHDLKKKTLSPHASGADDDSNAKIDEEILTLMAKLPPCVQDVVALQVDAVKSLATSIDNKKEYVEHSSSHAFNTVSTFVNTWSPDECALLLNLYLLGLAASDASVIISTQEACRTTEINSSMPTSLPTTVSIIRHQSHICSGMLQLCRRTTTENVVKHRIHYTVSVIDMDRKHPHKCWSKAEKERIICKHALDVLHDDNAERDID